MRGRGLIDGLTSERNWNQRHGKQHRAHRQIFQDHGVNVTHGKAGIYTGTATGARKINFARYTPTGNGLALDSSAFTPVRQRSNRPCSRLISPVYQ